MGWPKPADAQRAARRVAAALALWVAASASAAPQPAPGPASASTAAGEALPAAGLVITPLHQRWLATHTPVRFGPERDYGPFVYQQADGRLEGLSVDMLRLVQARTGLAVQEQPSAPLHALLLAAQARQVDLLSSLRPTPERAQFLRFTQPYVSVPAVLVRRAADPVLPLSELAGQPVAVGQGYAVEAVMRQRHPQVRWSPVSDDGLALQALLRGEVHAVVADAASVVFLMRTRGLQGLRLDAPVGFEYALSFAVRNDWPELVDIINRAIQQIGPQERQRLLDRWLTAPGTPALPGRSTRAVLWGLGLLALSVVAGLGLWWTRRRRDPRGAPAGRGEGGAAR